MTSDPPSPLKTVDWIASSLEDLRELDEEVRRVFGQALYHAQMGLKHPDAKPLQGERFKKYGVIEVVEDFDGDTYRCFYTTKIGDVIYVLDVFKKKSTTKSKTAVHDLNRIEARAKAAKEDYAMNYQRKDAG